MATRISPNLIFRAHQLGLFQGSPDYYFPEGAALPDERDHLVDVVVRTAIERLEASPAQPVSAQPVSG